MEDRAVALPLMMSGQEVAHATIIADAMALPVAANENMKLKSDWMTPAEAMQVIHRARQKLLRENRRLHSLLSQPQRRAAWDRVAACEQCLRWHYFRK